LEKEVLKASLEPRIDVEEVVIEGGDRCSCSLRTSAFGGVWFGIERDLRELIDPAVDVSEVGVAENDGGELRPGRRGFVWEGARDGCESGSRCSFLPPWLLLPVLFFLLRLLSLCRQRSSPENERLGADERAELLAEES